MRAQGSREGGWGGAATVTSLADCSEGQKPRRIERKEIDPLGSTMEWGREHLYELGIPKLENKYSLTPLCDDSPDTVSGDAEFGWDTVPIHIQRLRGISDSFV